MSDAATACCWIPERIVAEGDDERCRWVDVAQLRFTDPFFESTLARRRREGRAERWSPLSHLHDEAAAAVAPLVPAAFIFHVSRCGSTLFSQLLGLDERAIVLSEVPLLDRILRSAWPERERLFASVLRLLGRPRFGETRLFVKTDAWHLFHAATLRRLYPQAPFILLYRSPAGVLGSHQRMRGMHMVPGLLMDTPLCVDYDPARASLDQYAGRVLERYYRAMLDAAADPHSLLVSYAEGFPAALLRAARWLELSYDEDSLRRVHERCGYHGKKPHEAFGAERLPALPDVDLTVLEVLFDQLEHRRLGASARSPVGRERTSG